jgi:asparagine synthase (glutamine-hydrolysing)
MCGITGYARAFSSTAPLEAPDVLARMTARLVHRGPDAEGFHHEPEKGVALGQRRLVVIDREGGEQPMRHEASGLTLVFNGEIYNYRDLARELAGRGLHPRTRSDTETVLLSYIAWGPACVDRFNGMFAFVIHDAKRGLVFGARDRLGKKPLYYVHDGPLLAFASEPKALLEHPAVRRELDPASAARFLLYEHVPAPHAIWRGMAALPAAHRFSFDLERGRLDVGRYWDLPEETDKGPDGDEWCGLIRETLDRAVERRLLADVPLGVFLSGGIDSSAVTAVMARHLGAGKVKTFSIGFDDDRFDESARARRFAENLGTEHHERRVSPATVIETLPELVAHLDEPFADASILPTLLLSRFAREHVTVALGGDGGDELFAGYQTFRALRAARWYRALVPPPVHGRLVTPLARRLRAGNGYFSFDFKVKQFLRGARGPRNERLWRWLGSFTPHQACEVLSPELLEQLDTPPGYDDLHAPRTDRNDIDADTRLYLRTYLADGILTKVDRASMAVSLEARSPLLDVELVELALRIPGRLKVSRGRPKHLFKRALADLLPQDVLRGPKQGFALPVGAWLRGPLRELLLDTLSERALREGGLLRPETVKRLIDEHLSGSQDHRKPLFTLLMLELWRRHWLCDAPAALPLPASTSDEARKLAV